MRRLAETREETWAAETFTKFTLAFFRWLVEFTVSNPDPNHSPLTLKGLLFMMGEHGLESSARENVPGFEGDVVNDWGFEVEKYLRQLTEKFSLRWA